MLEKRKKRDKMHLINLIGRRSNNTPNFALLIGAGASVSSGVKPASEMTNEWRRQLYNQSRSRKAFDKWLEEQDWFEDEDEYSILFEKVYDQRSQRRIYIEECVKEAKPSWGYIYLANLISYNYFNVVFTPNFDDLLNEACFIYADCRPLVCAHDSAVADLRVTSARPKIMKLHGDFLYDSIKNTVRETETLEENMREKFKQFAREYGLVIIGYGGNDRSIMGILDTLLVSEGYFPNGLYWCTRKADASNRKMERLMKREKAYWIEIEGFDEFMAELHKGLGLTLPIAVRDPYKATTEKLNRFIEARKLIKHKIVQNDCQELEKEVKKIEQVVSGKLPTSEFDELVPYSFLAEIELQRGDYESALRYLERALLQNPKELTLMKKKVVTYMVLERFKDALLVSEEIVKLNPTDSIGNCLKGRSLKLLGKTKDAIIVYTKSLKYGTGLNKADALTGRSDAYLVAGEWKKALADAEKSLQIRYSEADILNKCFALNKLNKREEATKILRELAAKSENAYRRANAFALLDDKKNMLTELEVAFEEARSNAVDAKYDVTFADYREDSNFLKLVNKYTSIKKDS